MIKNYLKIALRNLFKNKTYSFINIFGLAAGIACSIILFLYIQNELSYDKVFGDYSNIYRVTMSSTIGDKVTKQPTISPLVANFLPQEFTGIKKTVRMISYKYNRQRPVVGLGNKIFYEEGFYFADSTFFDIFNFPFLAGDPHTALNEPNSVVITEKEANKYFNTTDVLGKTLYFNNSVNLKITGILKDLPANSHMQFDFLASMSSLPNSGMFTQNFNPFNYWEVDWFWTYVKFENKEAASRVSNGLDKFVSEHYPQMLKDTKAKLYLEPIASIHLSKDYNYGTDITDSSNKGYLYIFGTAAILIILISCINFMNISTAVSVKRIKEISLRKVLGAEKKQLIWQFLGESFISSFLSVLIAIGLLEFILPIFNIITDKTLSFSLFNNYWLILVLLGLWFLVGALSGIYPAFVASGFTPAVVLKGKGSVIRESKLFRNSLVVGQFAISITLIVGAIVVYTQLNYLRDKKLGFDKDRMVILTVRQSSIVKNYDSFKNELLRKQNIKNVTAVSEKIGRETQYMPFVVEQNPEQKFLRILRVNYDFIKTMKLTLVNGREFSKSIPTDFTSAYIINETAAKTLGWNANSAIDKSFKVGFPNFPQGKVIGVVKDFNFEPLYKNIEPVVIFLGPPAWYVAVKIGPANTAASLTEIKNTWNKFEPNKPFEYYFLDQSIKQVYRPEEKAESVFIYFSIFAIFIACLGLFGLITLSTEQRVKEIGIRKVLGATVSHIVGILSKDFLKLVILGNIVAWPVAYYVMHQWLSGFAYRINISVFTFIIAGLAAFFIAFITLLSKSVIAAIKNPVEVLKYE